MVKKPLYTILFISWVMFVTFLSLFSFTDSDLPSVKIPNFDKLVHFTFYFVASILGILAIKEWDGAKIPKVRSISSLAAALIVYGIIIEVLQSEYTTTRSGEILDFVANTVGVFVGIAAASILFYKK